MIVCDRCRSGLEVVRSQIVIRDSEIKDKPSCLPPLLLALDPDLCERCAAILASIVVDFCKPLPQSVPTR